MADHGEKNSLVRKVVLIAVAALGAYLILDACTASSSAEFASTALW